MREPRKYRLHPAGRTTIDHMALSGYIEATAYDVLHDDQLGGVEKVVSLHALARLTRALSDHWRQNSRYYGESAERVWFRMAGLDHDGLPTPEMIERVSDLEPLGSPDLYRPKHRARRAA
jgi:hypothetical protein